MKFNDGAYYGFDKDVDVYEANECTSTENQADTYDQYIGAESQLTNKDGVQSMERDRKILHCAYGNPEGNGNYRLWEEHTEYEIEFCDGSTSKLTVHIISENMLYQVNS